MDRTQKIRQFVEERFLIDFGGEVTAESDLFKAGVIDSFGYIQLMSFLEDEFSLRITDEEILGNIFVSLDGIDAFVAAKLAEGDVLCAD
ncbi:acyl carrier protein [Streptomyces olivoverticillatus]|uniref:Acyl carrier protein n=1 Tax=Streptomyces olivoverticillatus TaxID=66427 RepID=A0A7W7LN27_9ACTN|nr:acyl carrier protein [Streptomyces olivoverticillatus]MBB4893127.1 acyl carrier protein [Streptomyces olivoverticillatus]